MLATAPQQRLVSLALILLLLLSQVAAASEVSEHALCNEGVELTLGGSSDVNIAGLRDSASIDAAKLASDHTGHPHLCHVHPPAHSLPVNALAAPFDRSTPIFPPFRVALTHIATAPPVPPPNA